MRGKISSKLILLLITLGLAVAAVGCGQKGDLYLPDQKPKKSSQG